MPDFNHYNNAISERIFILSIHEQKAKGNLKEILLKNNMIIMKKHILTMQHM